MIEALITTRFRVVCGRLWTITRLGLCLLAVLLVSACMKSVELQDEPADVIERSIEPEPEPVEPPPEPEPEPEPPKPAPRYALAGRLSLTADSDNILNGNSMYNAVVYFMPDRNPPRVRPQKLTVAIEDKLFKPSLLVVPAGSEVTFPNNDNILHNVFSVSSGAQFDLGFYGNGEAPSYVFTQPGRALINCSVHNSMSADILVLDTPYYSQPDETGEFNLDNLPAGPGRLFVWHPQAREQSYPVTVPAAEPLNFELKLTKPLLPTGDE